MPAVPTVSSANPGEMPRMASFAHIRASLAAALLLASGVVVSVSAARAEDGQALTPTSPIYRRDLFRVLPREELLDDGDDESSGQDTSAGQVRVASPVADRTSVGQGGDNAGRLDPISSDRTSRRGAAPLDAGAVRPQPAAPARTELQDRRTEAASPSTAPATRPLALERGAIATPLPSSRRSVQPPPAATRVAPDAPETAQPMPTPVARPLQIAAPPHSPAPTVQPAPAPLAMTPLPAPTVQPAPAPLATRPLPAPPTSSLPAPPAAPIAALPSAPNQLPRSVRITKPEGPAPPPPLAEAARTASPSQAVADPAATSAFETRVNAALQSTAPRRLPPPEIANRPQPAPRADVPLRAASPTADSAPRSEGRVAEGSPPTATGVRSPGSTRVTLLVADQYRRAMGMAEKGALYAAEEQLLQTLWLIAQAGDEAADSHRHTEALTSALLAWREAEDLAPAIGPTVTSSHVKLLIDSHRTPLPPELEEGPVQALDVLQAYFAFAQDRMLEAVGHEPAATHVLYGLGRLQTAPTRLTTPRLRLGGAKAIAILQTALDVDERNYAAANELGVLLARCGRLEESRATLLQAASVVGEPEVWENLVAVGHRLGDGNLVRHANTQLLAARERRARGESPSAAPSASQIHWVTPETFATAPPETGLAAAHPPLSPPPQPPTPTVADNPDAGGRKGLFGWLPGRKSAPGSEKPAASTAHREADANRTR